MAKIETSVVISRPIGEVFTYMMEIKNWPQWHSGMLEAEQETEGPVGVGTKFRGLNQFLGRSMAWSSEVTEYEPNSKVAQRLQSGPVLFDQSFTFEPVEGGTKLSLFAEGETGGFFKLAEPILNRNMQNQLEENFAHLKEILEAQG